MMVLHEHIRQDKCLKSTFLETADLLTFKNFKFPNMAGNSPKVCLKVSIVGVTLKNVETPKYPLVSHNQC